MKKMNVVVTVACLMLFAKIGFSQTSHSVLIAPGGQLIFQPASLTINTGDTVIWTWQSSGHSTTSDATTGPEVWNSGIRNVGSTFSKVFTTPGRHPYHCIPHQSFGMVAEITVQAVTGIDDRGSATVDDFVLQQNYPNPFNATTKISYSIPKSAFVTLKIYDVRGKEIRTLVTEFQNANTYSVNFDASKLSSGVYFYKLQAGDFITTRKMIFLK